MDKDIQYIRTGISGSTGRSFFNDNRQSQEFVLLLLRGIETSNLGPACKLLEQHINEVNAGLAALDIQKMEVDQKRRLHLQSLPTDEVLMTMTNAELRDKLRSMGQITSGNKRELIERLKFPLL